MKKLLLLLILPLLIFTACNNEEDNPVAPTPKGNIIVKSTPAGAKIYLSGTNTGKVTPDTLKNLNAGVYTIKLVLDNYLDTSYTVNLAGNTTETINIVMRENFRGNLNIKSTPVGAQIWLNGVNTGKVTPDTLNYLRVGAHTIKLVKGNFFDSTFTVNVTLNQTTTYDINMDPLPVKYGPVRLWETLGTTAAQPSGLDLSTGNAYGISSANKVDVDIFYSSTGFIVRSANGASGMTRETWFKVGTGSDLTDGKDSPVRDNTWTTSMGDRELKYVYLYDADGNYSKLKIVNYGGGVPGTPAWVEVEWYYQTKVGSRAF